MTELIQSKEDREKFEADFGVYHDNINISIKKDGYDLGFAIGMFKKFEEYVAYAGANPKEAISGSGSNYTEAIESLLSKL